MMPPFRPSVTPADGPTKPRMAFKKRLPDMACIEDGFAIRHREGKIIIPGDGFHLAFTAPSQDAVVAFYQAALQFGGRDNGPAGLHPEHGANYFAAFVYDPDGYRIEAVLPPHS